MVDQVDVLETRFVLPDDLLIVPVSSLAEDARAAIDCADDDFAVARPRSRRPSSVVDEATAALLEQFRTPTRLVDAVLELSRARGSDPENTLEEAFGALQRFCNGRLLVPEDSDERQGVQASLAPGQQVSAWEILRPVHVLRDTELYQARGTSGSRDTVALKIHRGDRDGESAPIEREAAILRRLEGRHAPRLVEEGRCENRVFFAAEWRAGSAITTVADEMRETGDRRGLLKLSQALLEAYDSLHRRGVIHGDVHPGNVLVDHDGSVSIVDFGASRMLGSDHPWAEAPRAAVGSYYDPEMAAAVLTERLPPQAGPASDQYALAVLLYRLLTGRFPVDFRAEQEELLRQVVEADPLPFSRRGVAPWPETEAILRRALQKDPEERYPSLRRMREALTTLPEPGEPRRPGATRKGPDRVEPALERTGPDGFVAPERVSAADDASLWTGTAGMAWFLYRLATVRGDASALARADAWTSHIPSKAADSPSLYHSASGVHAVAALIARARGDRSTWRDQVAAFLAASSKPCDRLELALGRSGPLLAASVLLEADATLGASQSDALRAFLRQGIETIGREIADVTDIRASRRLPHLGMAHGWAGVLYAVLRAVRSTGAPVPGALASPLDQLARLACPAGRGLLWPGTPSPNSTEHTPGNAPGWCSGSAGHVHLWLAAHDVLGEARFLELAVRAAWAAWEHHDVSPTLCCGVAGRGLGLLALYRATGEEDWLRRAQTLLERIKPDASFPDDETALFKGSLGPALLQLELEDPDWAVMPLFGA